MSRQQLLDLGVGDKAIRHRVSRGRLIRVHAGVYTINPARLGGDGHFMAAVLACGEGTVLSHRCAAALWDIYPTPSGAIDVTTRPGTRRRRGIAIHTSRSLELEDVSARRGIPCTSLARTLLDLAGCVNRRRLERAIEQAQILQLYDHRALEAVLDRANGRHGAARLRRSLEGLADEPAPTRTELERRFLELVRAARLPTPVVNGIVCGYEVDFHWPPQRLIVETDGRSVHETPIAFERDRRHDLDLELAGWHVLRVSWRQLADYPGRIAAVLGDRLAASSAG